MRLLLGFFLLLDAAVLGSQTIDWEDLIDPEAGEDRAEELLEFFQWRQEHPLDINRARPSEWQQFPWIDSECARAIVAASSARGGFRRVEDLASIPALSEKSYRRLLPFVRCTPPKKKSAIFELDGRQRWMQKTPAGAENDPDIYAGNSSRWYQRLRLAVAERLHAGLLIEKDPGESSAADLRRGYGLWQMPWLAGRLCAGAFTLESGRGLIFARGGQWGRGFDPVASMRPQETVLRPCTSTCENGRDQGAAVAFEIRGFKIVAFQSRAKWDASLENGEVTALQWSGLHRSATEISKRDALTASARGVVARRRIGERLNIGLAWKTARYSRHFAPDPAIENLHDFSGAHNWNGGITAELYSGNITGFAEWARSRSGGSAMEGGALLRLKNMEGVVVLHHYGESYHRILGAGADEPRNNAGWGLAWQVELPRRMRLGASYDYGQTPAPAWRQPMPLVPRREAGVMLTWQPTAPITCFHRLRYKSWSLIESLDDRFGNSVKGWRDRACWSVLAQMEYQQKRLRWRTRLEYHRFQIGRGGTLLAATPDSSGWMLYQQLSLELGGRISLTGRYAFFDASCYETRFYLYENDLPGALTLPLLYGRGCRVFLLLHYGLSRYAVISAKWAWLGEDTAEVTSMGQEGSSAAGQSTVALQLDWRWPGR